MFSFYCSIRYRKHASVSDCVLLYHYKRWPSWSLHPAYKAVLRRIVRSNFQFQSTLDVVHQMCNKGVQLLWFLVRRQTGVVTKLSQLSARDNIRLRPRVWARSDSYCTTARSDLYSVVKPALKCVFNALIHRQEQ